MILIILDTLYIHTSLYVRCMLHVSLWYHNNYIILPLHYFFVCCTQGEVMTPRTGPRWNLGRSTHTLWTPQGHSPVRSWGHTRAWRPTITSPQDGCMLSCTLSAQTASTVHSKPECTGVRQPPALHMMPGSSWRRSPATLPGRTARAWRCRSTEGLRGCADNLCHQW